MLHKVNRAIEFVLPNLLRVARARAGTNQSHFVAGKRAQPFCGRLPGLFSYSRAMETYGKCLLQGNPLDWLVGLNLQDDELLRRKGFLLKQGTASLQALVSAVLLESVLFLLDPCRWLDYVKRGVEEAGINHPRYMLLINLFCP